ncbi:acyltransferase family protein [Peribacillus butanolivorans]|uniref:acyltransferase family protein n=1 Tax=Peribacillus butanolivorans TaxID=421767 RepID=UPI00167F72E6|nr:acyltransferase family protein [Peribacillus butanolivorans]QNU03888.1 acyltransferase [Peribacillus butanolivorans]
MQRNTKQYIGEIDTVRSIACLCVVLLHAINFGAGGGDYHEASGINKVWIAISSLLSFGTTTFIFISGMILAYSYPNKLPKNFYLERFKYIYLPFIFISLIFALYNSLGNVSGMPKLFVFNLMGYQHWFILVVLQFYLLYPLFNRLFQRYSPKLILFIALLINVTYLGVFNLFQVPINNKYFNYLWLQGYWAPFFGWIFYFTVAYYAGRNYDNFVMLIKKNKKWLYVLLPISIVISLNVNEIETFGFGSKRIDMIMFSTIMIFIIFLFAKKYKTPLILKVVSKYSFGIYLLHYLFLSIMDNLFKNLNIYSSLGYFSILILFIISIICSIFIIYLANNFKIGKFMFGKVKKTPKHSGEKNNNNTLLKDSV